MRNFNVTVNGKVFQVSVDEIGCESGSVSGQIPSVETAPASIAKQAAPVAVGKAVKSPMPGMVLSFKVENGATVKKNQPILVLEAMKMENEIVAVTDGVVTFNVQKGASVNTDDLLASIN